MWDHARSHAIGMMLSVVCYWYVLPYACCDIRKWELVISVGPSWIDLHFIVVEDTWKFTLFDMERISKRCSRQWGQSPKYWHLTE
jgi:hypothetical protein